MIENDLIAAVHLTIPPNTRLDVLERQAIEQTLEQHRGNRTHAAHALGISVRTLQRKLKSWEQEKQQKSRG